MSFVTASLSRVPHTTATKPPRKGGRCHVTLLIVGPFGNCLLTRYVSIGWRYKLICLVSLVLTENQSLVPLGTLLDHYYYYYYCCYD